MSAPRDTDACLDERIEAIKAYCQARVDDLALGLNAADPEFVKTAERDLADVVVRLAGRAYGLQVIVPKLLPDDGEIREAYVELLATSILPTEPFPDDV